MTDDIIGQNNDEGAVHNIFKFNDGSNKTKQKFITYLFIN